MSCIQWNAEELPVCSSSPLACTIALGSRKPSQGGLESNSNVVNLHRPAIRESLHTDYYYISGQQEGKTLSSGHILSEFNFPDRQ